MAALAVLAAGLLTQSAVTATAGPAQATAPVTNVIRPQGDVVRQWTGGTPGTAAAALDDIITQPTVVPAADYIRAGQANQVTQVTLTDVALSDRVPQQVNVWFYANTGSTTRLKVELVGAAAQVLASTTLTRGSGFAWRSLSTTLVPDQIGINGLSLRMTALDGGDSNVRAAYAAVTSADCDQQHPALGGYGGFGGTRWPVACWNPFSAGSAFNRRLPAAARVHPRSAQIVHRLRGDLARNKQVANLVAHDDGSSGEPTYYARASDPQYRIHCTANTDVGGWGGSACPMEGTTVRIPARAVPEGGQAADGTKPLYERADAHLTVVDQTTGTLTSFWQVQTMPLPSAGGRITVAWAGDSPIGGTGVATRGSATAANFASLAGRIRVEELQAGTIDHPLFIGVRCDSGSFVFPATHSGSSCARTSPPLATADAPAMGSLLRLDLTVAQIDALPATVPTWKRTILKAMSQYGMYIGDTGSSFYFTIETESGNQYTSMGAADAWLSFAARNGWPHRDTTADYPFAHRLGSMRSDADGIDWNATVWSKLVVLDPCVAQQNC